MLLMRGAFHWIAYAAGNKWPSLLHKNASESIISIKRNLENLMGLINLVAKNADCYKRAGTRLGILFVCFPLPQTFIHKSKVMNISNTSSSYFLHNNNPKR
uniref:Uncharacterized protein n=2 Tax=Micrurus TaxID=8634 RepID=A0A2D4JLY3_MICLE